MRINKYVAAATGMSRRKADSVVAEQRIQINGQTAGAGDSAEITDTVTLDGKPLRLAAETTTIILNKPVGYVVSRNGQGSQTIYDLLPPELHALKPVGRLDKDSSGLLLLTSDGDLANKLTHPSHQKAKVYKVTLDKPLQPLHHQMINDIGINLDDGKSRLILSKIDDGDRSWQVTMKEGRNRQIRRTFQALGYEVTSLNRITFGEFSLGDLRIGDNRVVNGNLADQT